MYNIELYINNYILYYEMTGFISIGFFQTIYYFVFKNSFFCTYITNQ